MADTPDKSRRIIVRGHIVFFEHDDKQFKLYVDEGRLVVEGNGYLTIRPDQNNLVYVFVQPSGGRNLIEE